MIRHLEGWEVPIVSKPFHKSQVRYQDTAVPTKVSSSGNQISSSLESFFHVCFEDKSEKERRHERCLLAGSFRFIRSRTRPEALSKMCAVAQWMKERGIYWRSAQVTAFLLKGWNFFQNPVRRALLWVKLHWHRLLLHSPKSFWSKYSDCFTV